MVWRNQHDRCVVQVDDTSMSVSEVICTVHTVCIWYICICEFTRNSSYGCAGDTIRNYRTHRSLAGTPVSRCMIDSGHTYNEFTTCIIVIISVTITLHMHISLIKSYITTFVHIMCVNKYHASILYVCTYVCMCDDSWWLLHPLHTRWHVMTWCCYSISKSS